MADRGGRARTVGDADDAEALYLLPPAQFVDARDQAVRSARERGDKDTARRLAGLRRPTTSAWLVNLLYHHQRDAVEGLLEIGEQLTEASRRLSGSDLQQLSAQRSQVVQALVAAARRLASEAGRTVSATTAYEVQSTLGAALADPGVAADVRSGRMVRPASYAGFGPDPQAGFGTPVGRVHTKNPPSRGGDGQKSRRLARARHDLDQARAAVEKAEGQLAESAAALADARRMCEQLDQDHQALTAQLADLEARQRQAAQRAETADRAYREAGDRRGQAQGRLEQARQGLDQAE